MREEEFAELASGHALNALSPQDERAFQQARAEHPEWEATAQRDADTVALLADGIADVVPPRFVRDALMAQIAVAPTGSTAGEAVARHSTVTRARSWGTRAWFALAASIALLLALGVGAGLLSQQLNRPAAVVALEQIEKAPDAQSASVDIAGGGTATAHWSASVGEAVLISDGLPAITDAQSFELWFVRDGTPISAGVFDASDGGATALLDGAMQAGDTIAVTVEKAGGSSDGKPTSDPIVVITTT